VVHDHVLKGVLWGSAGLLLGFSLLALIGTRERFWAWAGAAGPGDLRAIPLLVLYALALSLLLLPVQNAISRSFEAQADATAIRLTHDPAAGVRVFRELAFANISDLRPPKVAVVLFFDHPPTADRIRA